MNGSGGEFSSKGAEFAGQLVDLYASTIGEWATPIVAFAAFTAMFSTTLTLIDAYPRSLGVLVKLLFDKVTISDRKAHALAITICCVIGMVIIFKYTANLTALVDVVTTIAFLSAPMFSYMNMRVIHSEYLPEDAKPLRRMVLLSYVGLAYMIGFALLFIYIRFIQPECGELICF
jgi:Mn2+/Fe2+ NRAMP family transporter